MTDETYWACPDCWSDEIVGRQVGGGPTGVTAPDGGAEYWATAEGIECLACGALNDAPVERPVPAAWLIAAEVAVAEQREVEAWAA